ANTLRVTPQEVASHFMNLGADVTPGSFTPEIVKVKPGSLAVRDSWLKQGKYYIQDESSALAAHALGVQPGHLVYDLCSAPGGKATHLGQLMENRGRILAIDADPRRILRVEENARRLGITIIETRKADASKELNLKPAPRVLVDAPCTGWGTIRKRPDLRWRKKPSDVAKLIQIQRKILSRAARCVQKGGLLLYSTCTINKGENQDQAQWFLAEHPDFSGFPLPSWFPEPLGEPPWQRQLFPQIHNLDGFFLALFRKG
ncbi:MAG: 16S rRNA (cytosine(967)-C(5))-methyltransferase RsmB, partial [Firmicutes bacterium]|nr:16S rRNA (cytosine(967)-C(5))-methyltransferase RsmB [Bacillota bacterium]